MTKQVRHWMANRRGLRTATDGNVAVEFALILPVMMLLLVGIADIGLALHTRSQLEVAAQAGLEVARYDRTEDSVVLSAVQMATKMDPSALVVTTSEFCACADGQTIDCADDCSNGEFPGTFVRVDVNTDYQGLFDFGLATSLFSVTGQAIGRVQ